MIRTGLGIRETLKDPWRIALLFLPQPLVYELWHQKVIKNRRPDQKTASDVRVLRPQEGVILEVYWARVPVGWGPAASLSILKEEVLRLDCFGGQFGHMHFNPRQDMLLEESGFPHPRIYFQPGSILQQIERSAFELTHNAMYAKGTNLLRRVRRFPLDQMALKEAAPEMIKHMHALYEIHGLDSGLASRQDNPQDHREFAAVTGGDNHYSENLR
jgi:hypothetical protein